MSSSSERRAVDRAIKAVADGGGWAEGLRCLLRDAIEATDSEFGFIGMMYPDGVLRVYAQEGMSWHPAVGRELFDAATSAYRTQGYVEFDRFDNLFGDVLRTGREVISDEPYLDPRAGGLPSGHPNLKSFLGVPIMREDKAVGLFALANRPGGYQEAPLAFVNSLTAIALVLHHALAHEERSAAAQVELQRVARGQLVSALAGHVAHQFNNALLVIRGRAVEIERRLDRDTGTDAAAREIVNVADASAELVRELLALVGLVETGSGTVDVLPAIRELEPVIASELGQSLTLRLEVAEGLPRVAGDAGFLSMALLAFASNAREAAIGRGSATVIARLADHVDIPGKNLLQDPGDFVAISFVDDGRGMTPEVASSVFDPYFTTKPDRLGRGLSLSAVRGIARAYGGWLDVTSVPEKGTTMRLLLPAVEDVVPASATIGEEHASGVDPLQVVLVEDAGPARRLLADALRASGFDVAEFASSTLALAYASDRSRSLDVLVTDVVLPDFDGFQLAAALRAHRPGLRVVYISGYFESALKERVQDDPLLRKPFDPSVLVSVIREVAHP